MHDRRPSPPSAPLYGVARAPKPILGYLYCGKKRIFSTIIETDMFAYFAFKALKGRYPDALRSAYKKTRWEVDPSLDLPCLKAAKGTFKKGYGVYAATVAEAQRYANNYGGDVYLVAPLPGKQIVVGETGWRAEAAVCLGLLTKENAPQIARLVLIAHSQGLPQVKDVLCWAVEQVCLEAWWATPYRALVLCALDELRDAEVLYIAGKAHLGDERDGDAILEAFLKRANPEFLHRAGCDRSMRRYSDIVAQALAMTGDAKYLYLAGREWPDGRFTPEIAQALINTRDAEHLYLAGRDWPEGHFTPEIAQALINTCEAVCLYFAGKDWPDGRFTPEIAQALINIRDAWYLYHAGRDWPDGRFTSEIAKALAESGDATYLYLAGHD